MSRGAGGRVFLFYLERLGGGEKKPIVSSKAVVEDLNMKFRSKFNHGFTNPGCLARNMQSFHQNVQNEIFKILKMSKYNMKFTRAACWDQKPETKTPHSLYCYFATVVGIYYGVIIQGL